MQKWDWMLEIMISILIQKWRDTVILSLNPKKRAQRFIEKIVAIIFSVL